MAAHAQFSVGFKVSDNLHMSSPISAYIQSAYHMDPKVYADDIAQLERLRSDAASPELHQASLDRVYQYYSQLVQLGGKLPFDESSIRIGWRWYSSFERGKKKPVTSVDIKFELANVLFNIGALHNQLGLSMMNKSNADSLKSAAFHFQASAGAFQEIISQYATEIAKTIVAPDLSESVLSTLVTMNLGLAQECFYYKANLDQMKDGTICKVAAGAAELFSTAFDSASVEASKGVFSDWLVSLQTRALYHNANAQIRRANECGATSKYGEEVARLKFAEALLKKAKDFKALPSSVHAEYKELLEVVRENLRKCEKDNDVIYLERVPKDTELAAIAKVQLAKTTAVAPLNVSPLFAKLFPAEVQHQMLLYADRKKTLVDTQVGKLNKMQGDYNQVMSNLDLPGSLQAFEKPIGLPEELLKKSNEVRENGGARSLSDQMHTMLAISMENAKMLKEIESILETERGEDDECKRTFATGWNRKSSAELQKPLRDKLEARQKTFEAARKGDATLRMKLDDGLPHMTSLSGTREELEHSIPASTQNTAVGRNDATVTQLKRLLSEGAQLQTNRSNLAENFKKTASSEDPASLFLEAFSSGTKNYHDCFDKALARFNPLIAELDKIATQQQNLLAGITSANQAFAASVKNNDGLKQRQEALQALDKAYICFKYLQDHLREGMVFHTDFQGILTNLKSQCVDFCAARALEKKDLLREITETAAGPPALPPRETGNNSVPQLGQWNQQVPLSYGNQSSAAPPAYGYYNAQPAPGIYGQPQQQAPGVYGQAQQPQYGQQQQNPYGQAPQTNAYQPAGGNGPPYTNPFGAQSPPANQQQPLYGQPPNVAPYGPASGTNRPNSGNTYYSK